MISDKPVIQDLLSILTQHKLKHVVISPGSRHAPVSLSFFHHPNITCHVIPDERSAGYFALGMAQELGETVALVCTSGTAAANYLSACAEAFYQEIPLLFITTDRPQEWVDQGDGQTIRQQGILSNHVLAEFHLQQDDEHEDVKWHNQRMINEAFLTTNGVVNGPVHLNIPLREPLYHLVESSTTRPKVVRREPNYPAIGAQQLDDLKQTYANAKKVMVITGHHLPDDSLTAAIASIASNANTLVLTETTSNCGNGEVVSCIDRLIMTLENGERDQFQPELLITFGSQIISKKIKALLRGMDIEAHWHLDPEGRVLDTFKHLTEIIRTQPADLISELGDVETVDSEYHQHWFRRHKELEPIQHEIAKTSGWSDLFVFSTILAQLPSGSRFQMGNSSVVRYVQLFNQRADIKYFGNRGTSGIDGCTSTASGMASVADDSVVLVTGDISFFYDINGFWNDQNLSKLKVILINNGGGNIFRIIDGPSSTQALETVFETRHQRNASHLAAHFGIGYSSASNPEELNQELNQLFEAEQCGVLEVFTQDIENDQVLKEAFKSSKKRIKHNG